MITRVLREIRDHAAGAVDPEIEATIIQPGQEVAWDDMCGLLWVRLIEVTPQYISNVACPVGMLFTVGVGMYRCVASIDSSTRAPSPAQITADGEQMTDDVQALYDALKEFVPPSAERAFLGPWGPLGPMGAAAGGEWTFEVRVVT